MEGFKLPEGTRVLCIQGVCSVKAGYEMYSEFFIYQVQQDTLIRDNRGTMVTWVNGKELFETYFVTLTD